jgi:SAM-dependent methyltransferase
MPSKQFPPPVVDRIRRSRRHPSLSQFDYLHLHYLAADLQTVLLQVEPPPRDVLDVYCGTRPYDDLLPTTARCVGLDIVGNPYGVADVVSDAFLPFDDESFDLVICIQAFYYVPDPVRGASEIRRVLRPGGTAVITVPFASEYDRRILQHRFTGPELEELFRDWDNVRVVENGGRCVTWTSVTASLLRSGENQLRSRLDGMVAPIFAAAYLALNGVGLLLASLERKHARGPQALPINLLLSARKPAR